MILIKKKTDEEISLKKACNHHKHIHYLIYWKNLRVLPEKKNRRMHVTH